MGFSIAAGLAGFAKRGMQFNDEQRQLTNENIKAAVNLTATDALAQRAARKKIKTDYRNTATQMKSMGMDDIQIEAAYGEYGNDAYTKIKGSLNDHITNWKLTNEKNGTGRDWTIEDTRGWLAQQFSVPEGAVGRSIEEQAQARADTVAPMTTANFEDIARGIVAGSGEITMASSDSRANKLAQQMRASFDAASGGIKETEDGATFNAQGVQVNLQPTAAEMRAVRQDIAATDTAESGAVVAGVDADFARELKEGQIDALELGNVLRTQNIAQLEQMNPLLVQQLQGKIQGQNLDNLFAQATQGDRIARTQLEVALGEVRLEADLLNNTLTKMKIDQEPRRFALQMEQLGLNIAGMKSDNIVKEVQAENAPLMAELSKELKLIEVEQGALRTSLLGEQVEAAENKNALAGLEEDVLRGRLEKLRVDIKNAKSPTTFSAAILEIDQALSDTDPSDPEYDILVDEKTRVMASLAAYTDATDTSQTGSRDPKFNTMITSYGTSLRAKLNDKGLMGNVNFIKDESTGAVTVAWRGSDEAREEFDTVVNRHKAVYAQSIAGFEQGNQATQALGLTFGFLPMRRIVDPSTGPNVSQPQFTDIPALEPGMIGEVYRSDQYGGLVQVVRADDDPNALILDTIE